MFRIYMMKTIGLIVLISFSLGVVGPMYAQCPTSGTISSNCTTSGNWTASGNVTVNSGVTMTITGTMTLNAGRTITGTGANFNIGAFSEGNGTLNTVTGGNWTIGGAFNTGGGGSFTISGATVSMAGVLSLNGATLTLTSSTFTGVTNVSTNVSALSMTNVNITASGSTQFEDATVSGGTITTGTSLTINNGTNSFSGTTFNVGTTASIKNTTLTNGSISTGGKMTIESGTVNFSNSDIGVGTNNPASGTTSLEFNGGGILNLTNGTQFNVRGDVVNNEWLIDNSDVTITGNFDNAGSEILTVQNDGTINIGENFNNSGSGRVYADDGGLVKIDGDFNNTGGGAVDVDGGTFFVGGTFSGSTPTGDAGNCSSGNGGCCGAGCAALPVSLVDLVGILKGSFIDLTWQTASEQDNDFFTLERSWDGKVFSEIGRIPGSGSVSHLTSYRYQDFINFRTALYYRLSQTDFDGTHKHLKVIVVNAGELHQKVQIFPNPVLAPSYVEVAGANIEDEWFLFSPTSQLLMSGFLDVKKQIEINLPQGLYVLKIQTAGQTVVERIVVQ